MSQRSHSDEESGCLRLVFRIAGEGTREFSRLETGDKVDTGAALVVLA